MAVLSPTANAVIGLKLPMVAVAAVEGYGRQMEREADDAAKKAAAKQAAPKQ